jgi:FAS-associated factor 2
MARPTKELEELRRLRAEQDAAYEESAAIDREKARKQRAVEEAKRQEEQREEERKQGIRKQKQDFVERLPPEPETGAVGTFAVTAVLPGGKRITRRSTETI